VFGGSVFDGLPSGGSRTDFGGTTGAGFASGPAVSGSGSVDPVRGSSLTR
jgi:hypothetical protein